VAGTASDFISEGLGPYLSPYVTPQFASLINGILNALSVKSTIQSTGTYPIISFPTIQGGTISALFNWSCVGVSSVLIFSIILVVLLIEEHSNLKTRMIWSIIGIAGIWILNVPRVVIILLADYFYGAEVGGMIHYVIGYTIFITWLSAFLYLWSKRTGRASL
jgi:exosortase/archaeosortase family protein